MPKQMQSAELSVSLPADPRAWPRLIAAALTETARQHARLDAGHVLRTVAVSLIIASEMEVEPSTP
jgi:hypothetical protein